MDRSIRCPRCEAAFDIDQEEYALIASQVRTREFDSELHRAVEDRVKQAGQEAELRVQETLVEAGKREEELRQKLQMTEKELELYRDLKARMSTKMLGETLEQHCEIAFEQLRAVGFQSAQFGKDNDARSGSKGDYIFRDFDENGMEYISIMFEMKNEMETTATKKKNSEHFEKLNKDRCSKKCEYAVLVSLLEKDNESYNSGIVDVSHVYPKMYVIRPQFFIPMITILRNAARNTLSAQQELAKLRQQNVEVDGFESRLMEFKKYISDKYQEAEQKLDDSIAEVDKAIAELEKVRAGLEGAKEKFRLSDKKAAGITIKKLTKGLPTVQKMLDEA